MFDNNTEYWKKRMIDRLRSIVTQVDADFKDIFNNATHIKMDTKPLLKQMRVCMDEFAKLSELIKTWKEAK